MSPSDSNSSSSSRGPLQVQDHSTNTEEEEYDRLVVGDDNGEMTLIKDVSISQLETARHLLYVSHAWNQFSELAWQFCLVMFLAAILNYKSLLLVSTYGIAVQTMVCVGSPILGKWVDHAAQTGDRLTLAHRLILTENICVLLATGCCWYLLQIMNINHGEESSFTACTTTTMSITTLWQQQPTISIFLLVGIHFLGALAQVLDKSFLVAVERDWIVIMAHNTRSTITSARHPGDDCWLSQTNVTMKQIDLTCQIIAPAITGWLLTYWAAGNYDDNRVSSDWSSGAILWVGGWNVMALLVEWVCTTRIYRMIPNLSTKLQLQLQDDSQEGNAQEMSETSTLEEQEHHNMLTPHQQPSRCCRLLGFKSLDTYFQQRAVAWGGVGLALLYFNVLTFSGMMTAYLVSRGMSFGRIGTWRGISSAVGLLGTFCYHWSAKRFRLEFTGLWSIIFEFACLSVTFGSIFIVSNDDLSLTLLIAGVLPSRIGLWVYDIAMTQMMQEVVAPPVRGSVGGTQNSMNAVCELLPYLLGIIFSKPSQFHVFIVGGYVAVAIAMVLYIIGVYIPHRKEGLIIETSKDSGAFELVETGTQ
jgi:iron-regulated transporter 1